MRSGAADILEHPPDGDIDVVQRTFGLVQCNCNMYSVQYSKVVQYRLHTPQSVY